jgi:hypothetical protein
MRRLCLAINGVALLITPAAAQDEGELAAQAAAAAAALQSTAGPTTICPS